jgi:integrase
MKFFVYKPKRKKNGKVVSGRLYRGRYKLEDDSLAIDVTLGVTDKQVAWTKMEKIVREAQQERYGIIPSKKTNDALKVPLKEYLQEFIAELQRLGRDRHYVRQRENMLTLLFSACRWKILTDVTVDPFLKWRREYHASPKTLNEYLLAANTFIGWLKRSKRLLFENPLEFIEKISTVGKQTYERRPLTDEELQNLIKLSGPRGVVYLTAAHTGLRRKELHTLRWSEVFLDVQAPYVAVKAANAKNRKMQPLPLHPEVVAALKELRHSRKPNASERVFHGIYPKWETFRNDLKRAGIKNMDDPSGKVHFHSLRHTLNHRLQENGVVPTVAQHLMRHSNINLTTRIYINSASLPLADAMRKVPSIISVEQPDTPMDTLNSDAGCHSVSLAVAEPEKIDKHKSLKSKDLSQNLSHSVVECHDRGDGARCRVRTCDSCRVKAVLYH